MKSISVSDELHKVIMDRKNSELKSADLVIGWMIEQEQAVSEAMINNEGDLLMNILQYVDKLTCINCGEKLIDEQSTKTLDTLGTIYLDPGSRNYPYEPDEPAGIYFICVNCAEGSI